MKRSKVIIIIVAAVFLTGAGFAAGMLAKTSTADKNDINLDDAKQIALSSVGVSAEKAAFTKEEFDGDSYDIEFYTESNEYDFEINSHTGAIIDREVSPRDLGLSDGAAADPGQISEPADDSVIGVDAAKDIALRHAGVSSASFHSAHLDYDDGARVYDIEFSVGGLTYDYEINAITGNIIEYDVEHFEHDD